MQSGSNISVDEKLLWNYALGNNIRKYRKVNSKDGTRKANGILEKHEGNTITVFYIATNQCILSMT